MTKSEYAKTLTDPRWKKLRLKVIKRDRYRCRKCGKLGLLNVHHLRYTRGQMPWEAQTYDLISLCEDCHYKAHENRTIKSFFKSGNPIRLDPKHKPRIKSPIEGLIWVPGKGLVPKKGQPF